MKSKVNVQIPLGLANPPEDLGAGSQARTRLL